MKRRLILFLTAAILFALDAAAALSARPGAVASGSTRITDTSRHNALAHQRSGSELLYYEKQMLERWLKSERPLVEPGQSVPDAAVVKIRTQGGLLAAKP